MSTLSSPVDLAVQAFDPGAGVPLGDDREKAGSTRQEALARYRRLREVNRDHTSAAMDRVSRKMLIYWAKRLGLLIGKTFIADGEEEMTLLFDMAIFSGKSGKSPAIDRLGRSSVFPEDSDEAVMLDAMRRSRFSLFTVKGRHPTAGLVMEDWLQERDIWLMDEGFEQSAPEGATFAARVFKPDDFYMTTGVAIPFEPDDLDLVLFAFPPRWNDPPLEEGRNARFIETVYKVAVRMGLMGTISFR